MVKAISDGSGVFIVASTSGTANPAQWLVDWVRGGNEVDSGVSVSGKTALRFSSVWYEVRKIAGCLAQMPLVLYEELDERTTRRAKSHPAYALIKSRPSAVMTASVFKETVQYHATMWGNGRAAIIRDPRGRPVELVPLMPDRTRTVLVNGGKFHVTKILDAETLDPDVWFSDQAQSAEPIVIPDRDVLHIVGLGFDGFSGYPLWDLAKNSWGLGLAGEKHQGRTYKNNAIPGLLLEAPPGVFRDDEDAKTFLQAFRSAHEGSQNAGKAGLLREGIKASRISQTGSDIQHLENRTFQRDEAALWFLETLSGNSYNSLEQRNLDYLTYALGSWLVKWSEECEAKLLTEREKAADSHSFRWSTGTLLRTDMRSTATTLSTLVRGRIMTSNEARQRLDLNPLDGGDKLENPAIDTRAAGADASEGSDSSDSPDRKRLRAIVRGRLGELAAVEQRRVGEIREKHGADAGEHVVSFYRGWKTTLAAAFETLGAASVFAKTLANQWIEFGHEKDNAQQLDRFADRLLAGV